MCSRSSTKSSLGYFTGFSVRYRKFDFVGGNCTGLLNIQFVLLDRNLPWDVNTLRDHSLDATLPRDHMWDISFFE